MSRNSIFWGIVFVLVGFLALMNQFTPGHIQWSIIWPSLLIIAGLWFIFVDAYNSHHKKDWLDEITDSMRSNPIIIKHHVILGVAHGGWEVSVKEFKKLKNPDGEAHYFVSKSYAKLKQQAKANIHLNRSKELGYKPTMGAMDVCRRMSGIEYFSSKKWDSSIRKLKEINDPDSESYFYLAKAYIELSKHNEAKKNLLRAKKMGHPDAGTLLDKM